MCDRCIEDVKIFLNQNTIALTEDKHNMRRVLTADLTGKLCNIDKIKAEMKGSNLEIVIPKIEIEETDMIALWYSVLSIIFLHFLINISLSLPLLVQIIAYIAFIHSYYKYGTRTECK